MTSTEIEFRTPRSFFEWVYWGALLLEVAFGSVAIGLVVASILFLSPIVISGNELEVDVIFVLFGLAAAVICGLLSYVLSIFCREHRQRM
jgi:predicted membrane protein